MQLVDVFVLLTLFGASGALTALLRRRAVKNGMLDIPNTRSSHSIPTPRGGGLAIMVGIEVAAIYFWTRGQLDAALLTSLLMGGGAVAGVGYVDDVRGLKARTRFAIHAVAAFLAVVLLGGSALSFTVFPVLPVVLGLFILVLAICWSVNLFNFMDGIDGIAASQFMFVCLAAAGLVWSSRGPSASVGLLLACAAAAGGFLIWNWAPAKIFMGDVGSGFLGYVIAVLALSFTAKEQLPLWTWVVLHAVFIADATVTLVRRAWSGGKWFEAHRSHGYQRLSRRWASHARVCQTLWALDLLLLPPAYWSTLHPDASLWIALASLGILGCLLYLLGAGRAEYE